MGRVADAAAQQHRGQDQQDQICTGGNECVARSRWRVCQRSAIHQSIRCVQGGNRSNEQKARAAQDERELERDLALWRAERSALYTKGRLHAAREAAATRAFDVFKLLHKQKLKSATPPTPSTERHEERHDHVSKTAELYVPKMLPYALTDTEVRRFKLNLDRADDDRLSPLRQSTALRRDRYVVPMSNHSHSLSQAVLVLACVFFSVRFTC